MDKALIHVDYTNDFVATDGKLSSGKAGQSVHDRIVAITKKFYEEGQFIAFTIDAHTKDDPYHPETKLFPAHNIIGTDGRNLYGDLQAYYQTIKDSANVYYTDKTRYSAFVGTDLDQKLQERKIHEVHILGVVTDICILHTAIDAYNRGYKIVIHEDGVQSFNRAGHEWALTHFTDVLGAQVIKNY